jgi:hypothetical protein
MKKLTMELEMLRVESFETGMGAGFGTVRGHALAGPVAIVETDDPFGCLRSRADCLYAPVGIVETDDPRGCMRFTGNCVAVIGEPAPADSAVA